MTNRRKIFIVDDNEMERLILNNILDNEYDVIMAESGAEALKVLVKQYQEIDLMVLDMIMPGMTGFELLQKISENKKWAQIPVIVSTALTEDEAKEKCLELGATAFVSKPYTPSLILNTIRNCIRLHDTEIILEASRTDELTQLYNRKAFISEAETLVKNQIADSYILSCFNIENFKVINDQYGSQTGDKILCYVADCLTDLCNTVKAICCRYSGDKFAILYPKDCLKTNILPALHLKLSNPPCIDHRIKIRIGRYNVIDLSLTIDSMFDRASLAEESIKGVYGKSIAEYTDSMRDSLLKEQEIVNDAQSALNQKQFEAWYQPQYNHETGALMGAEALVRWRHPEKGLIPPGIFIPIFEKNGFVYSVDKFIWEETCINLSRWLSEGRNPLPVSVNISRIDIFSPDFFEVITGLVKKYKLPIELLRLEVTESAFTNSSEHLIKIVKQLVEYGFTVEIDDFGSGYSSLNTLKNVPAQILKMDMRFLESSGDIEDEKRGGNIIESIIRMAKWINMSVIAEGVETKEQADYLKTIGCFCIQGYYYSKPLPLAEYEKRLDDNVHDMRHENLTSIANYNNSNFWNPNSIESLMFNSYVGGASILEYYNDKLEKVRVNDRFNDEFGYRKLKGKLISKMSPTETLDEENYKTLRQTLKRAIETNKEAYCNLQINNLDDDTNSVMYMRWTARLIAQTEERYLFYCVVFDVTEQTKKDFQLKALASSIPGGLATYLIDNNKLSCIYFNDGFFSHTGYTREEYEELTNKDPLAIMLKDDHYKLRKFLNDLSENPQVGDTASFIYRCYDKDGLIHYLNIKTNIAEVKDKTFIVHVVQMDITDQKRIEKDLRTTEMEYRLAVKQSGLLLARFNIQAKTLVFSPERPKAFQLPSTIENFPACKANPTYVSNDTIGSYLDFYARISNGQKECEATFQLFIANDWMWLKAHATTIFSDDNKPISAVISYKNISEQVEKEALIKKWNQSIEHRPVDTYTFFKCDLSRDISFDIREGSLINFKFKYNKTISFDELTLKYAKTSVYDDDREEYIMMLSSNRLIADYYRGKSSFTLDYREIVDQDTLRWIRLSIDVVQRPESKAILVYLFYENIDETKRDDIHTRLLAKTDPLTGLLNRESFEKKMNKIISSAKPDTYTALIMIDMDGFKQVNDTFGHAAGDKVLADSGLAICSAVRNSDPVCRLGGDEFLVCLGNVPNLEIIKKKVLQIGALVHQSLSPEVQISASIGIAIYPDDGKSFDTLYYQADKAMYSVKESGKDSYAFYNANSTELQVHTIFEERGDSNKKHMLIVDDDENACALIANIFKDEFICDKIYSGGEALSFLRQHSSSISIVLLDLVMPDINGFTVLKKMSIIPELQMIPVIVVTGMNDYETNIKAIKQGAAEFVTKPLDPILLSLRVQSALNKYDMMRLSSQNNYLKLMDKQNNKFRHILEKEGISVAVFDIDKKTFDYDYSMAKHLAGRYDKRPIWKIFLEDGVCSKEDTDLLQRKIEEILTLNSKEPCEMTMQLVDSHKKTRSFSVTLIKHKDEAQELNELLFSFKTVL